MTDGLLKMQMLDWINGYCNQKFDIDDLPPAIEMVLNRMLESVSNVPAGVASQSAGGLSISYMGVDTGGLREVEKLLAPFVKMKVK